MIRRTSSAGAAAVAVAMISFSMSSSASAQVGVGAPIIIAENNTIVTLQFLSAEAAYTGELSFLGFGTEAIVLQPATDTGAPGLGQQTFVNLTGQPTDTVVLAGEFNAGDVLHFGYRVTEPTGEADTLRSDDLATAEHFAWDSTSGLLQIEDLRPGHPLYDADYDDIIVRVTFATSSAPAPGSALAFLAGGVIGIGRRRRAA